MLAARRSQFKKNSLETRHGDEWQRPPKLPDEARAFIESASVEHCELADEFRAGI
jgi:hypothetical protein